MFSNKNPGIFAGEFLIFTACLQDQKKWQNIDQIKKPDLENEQNIYWRISEFYAYRN